MTPPEMLTNVEFVLANPVMPGARFTRPQMTTQVLEVSVRVASPEMTGAVRRRTSVVSGFAARAAS